MELAAGQPVAAVAAGDVDLAIGPLTTVLAAPGVQPVAVFPSDLGADIEMAMFLSAAPRDRGQTMLLLEFLGDASVDGWLAAGGVMRE